MKKYKFNGGKDRGYWQISFEGRLLAPLITRQPNGMCTISENGAQWPGRYVDRHYAARDIMRREGLWDEDKDNDWMGVGLKQSMKRQKAID